MVNKNEILVSFPSPWSSYKIINIIGKYQLMGHKSSLTFIPQMNDKETHVVMDIREHCKEQMANEHVRDWGARRKT